MASRYVRPDVEAKHHREENSNCPFHAAILSPPTPGNGELRQQRLTDYYSSTMKRIEGIALPVEREFV